MSKIPILDILFGKDENATTEGRGPGREIFSMEFSGTMTKQMQRLLSRRFFRFTKAVANLLSHISTKNYGAACLSFGLFGIISYFAKISADNSFVTPIIGALFCLISIPLFIADKPLPMLMQDFALTDFIFYDFFCMKRHSVTEGEKKIPIIFSIVVGLIPAAFGMVFPLWQVALVLGVLLFLYIAIESPEFVFFISLFFLPYFRYIPYSEALLCALAVIALFSFVRKVFYGKRVLYIETNDIIIFIMVIFIMISGIFIKGVESFEGAIQMAILSLGYILAGNIITNVRLAKRSFHSVMMSAVFASIISIVEIIALTIHYGRITLTASEMSFILARQDGMTVIILVAALFSAAMIIKAHSLASRILYAASMVLTLVSLVITGEFFAFVAFFIGVFAYVALKINKWIAVIIPALVILPYAFLLIPNSALNGLFLQSPSLDSAEELFAIWGASIKAFSENLLVGIGIGPDCFATEMAERGIFGVVDSSNLFIEIALEAGIFALIFFLVVLVIRIRNRRDYYVYTKNSEISTTSIISGVCLISLLAFGAANYIWSNMAVYYLFWCLFGMGSSTLRVAKKEYDDRVRYYEETSQQDYSVIDVDIGKK